MKQFKDLGIQPIQQGLTGDKIKIERILNREITVHKYTIEDSKFDKGNGKCLYLQISIGDTMNVVFTGSVNLMLLIKQVAAIDFPFKTTIVKDNDRFQFT